MDYNLIIEAGLTQGEAKVYLSLLNLGTSTSGPIVKDSRVANSIIYRILESLIQKGLVSFIIKEKTKYFTAAPPERILDYIDERKEKLDENMEKIKKILPDLKSKLTQEETKVTVYEGFKGYITAFELLYLKLKKGDEYHAYGAYPEQEEKYHAYWKRDHIRRGKAGVSCKLLFNQGTSPEIIKNRNSYKLIDARVMPSGIITPTWFMTYKDTTAIMLQKKKPIAVIIENQEIADSFEAYFQDLWKRTKPFNK